MLSHPLSHLRQIDLKSGRILFSECPVVARREPSGIRTRACNSSRLLIQWCSYLPSWCARRCNSPCFDKSACRSARSGRTTELSADRWDHPSWSAIWLSSLLSSLFLRSQPSYPYLRARSTDSSVTGRSRQSIFDPRSVSDVLRSTASLMQPNACTVKAR